MQLPNFGQPQNQNPYAIPQPGTPKKTIFVIAGGALLLILVLGWLLFGGKGTPGATDMKATVQNTADSLGVIDAYQEKLQNAPAQNDIALIQILLRGNYQNFNTLYTKTYKPKKKFSTSPRADATSVTDLDTAFRNNLLDTQIFITLKPKVEAALLSSKKVAPDFKKPSSVSQITTAEKDYQAILDIINKPR